MALARRAGGQRNLLVKASPLQVTFIILHRLSECKNFFKVLQRFAGNFTPEGAETKSLQSTL
jgi:hypothetical protein